MELDKAMPERSEVSEAEVLEAAMEAGHILLENGAEISRVEETMERICRAYGVSGEQFFVLSNGIFTTGGPAFAKVQHIPVKGTDLSRIAAVNQISREVEKGKYSISELLIKLSEVRNMRGKRRIYQILASGIGSGAFCYLFGGSVFDSAAACAAGIVLYAYILFFAVKHLSKIPTNIMGGALVTVLCIAFSYIGFGENLSSMIIGAIIPLVPGVSFVNGIRDIADGDYLAGTVRLLDATLVFLCIAIGVGVIFSLYQSFLGGAVL